MKPSRFAAELAVLLDDNVHVPIAQALAFEQSLVEAPSDPATRSAYRDWLMEQGCPARAEQLARGVHDQGPGVYEGEVRPRGGRWEALCGLPEGTPPEYIRGFNDAMTTLAFWLDFRNGTSRTVDEKAYPLYSLEMYKSALLGRLVRGEEVRRRPCPVHRGTMWCSFGFDALSCVCEGTGWLANDYDGPLPEAS